MAKRTAYYGCMLSFAVICGYVEYLIPFDFGIPGMKLGLANAVGLFLIYSEKPVTAAVITVMRIFICGILFGNAFGIVYSLSGAALSLAVMFILSKIKCFSPIGASAAGGFFHNVGQLTAAAIILETKAIIYYFPFLAAAGIVTGVLVGILTAYVLKHINGKLKL